MTDEVTPNQGTGPGDHPGGGHAPIALDGGGGPGDHPGVKVVQLSGDPAADANVMETLLDTGYTFLFEYTAGGMTFAVFITGYK